MPLNLYKRPKTPNWIMRGTVRGQSIEETTGTTDRKAAEAIRIQREKELLDRSVYGERVTITFAEAAFDYLKYGGRGGDGGEKRFLRQLADHFGSTLLHKIGQDEIDRAAMKLYPNAGPGTRNRQAYGPMAAILRHAARKGWCATPVLRRPSQPKGKLRWLKPEEADRLIDACAPHLRPLVIFLIYTGARAGEAVWLDWSNVALANRQVTFPQTKNGMPRSVPLHRRVCEALNGSNQRSGPVFLTHKGQPYGAPSKEDDADTSAGSRISSAFFTACKRAGLCWPALDKNGNPKFKTDVTPHACRHTWASWHYQENRDLTALQALGGWKSVDMVLRYAHTNVENHAESIDALPWGNSGEVKNTIAEKVT